MKKISIKLRETSISNESTILIGTEILKAAASWIKQRGIAQAYILCDRRLMPIAARMERYLKGAGCTADTTFLTANENAKRYDNILPLYTELIKSGLDRKGVLIAIGGGVLGDIAGFVASTYLRGVRWINIPTTLLAQVDSAIGGKTGVNHQLGKNLIGTFHQPSLVLCDSEILRTLPMRERVSGYGEMVKYGIAFDRNYFKFLSHNQKALLRGNPRQLSGAVAQSVRLKARVVSRDVFERKGERVLLNLGHTVGHALEAATGFKRFRHGEAVIWGLRAAVALSAIRGHLSSAKEKEIDSVLARVKVPQLPKLSLRELLSLIQRDKKRSRGKVHFVLLSDIGKTCIDENIHSNDLKQAFQKLGVRLK
jgi:3-dehydroquinate synthase